MEQFPKYDLYREITCTDRNETRLVPIRSTSLFFYPTFHAILSIHEGNDGDSYYIKRPKINNSPELTLQTQQIQCLYTLGFPVPRVIVPIEKTKTDTFGTRVAGKSINVVSETHAYQGNEEQKLYISVGEALRDIHNRLATTPFARNVTNISYKNRSHPVDFFFYNNIHPEYRPTTEAYTATKVANAKSRNIGGFTELAWNTYDGYRINTPFIPLLKEQVPGQLQGLLDKTNALANDYMNKLKPYVYGATKDAGVFLNCKDQDLFYGDFKQENILAEKKNSTWNIRVVDPEISLGSKYFDHARFIYQYILNNPSVNARQYLNHFIKGYGAIPSPELNIYGPFTLPDLILIDMINLLQVCIKKYVTGDRSTEILKKLDSPVYTDQVSKTIDQLKQMKDQKSFDAFMHGSMVHRI